MQDSKIYKIGFILMIYK